MRGATPQSSFASDGNPDRPDSDATANSTLRYRANTQRARHRALVLKHNELEAHQRSLGEQVRPLAAKRREIISVYQRKKHVSPLAGLVTNPDNWVVFIGIVFVVAIGFAINTTRDQILFASIALVPPVAAGLMMWALHAWQIRAWENIDTARDEALDPVVSAIRELEQKNDRMNERVKTLKKHIRDCEQAMSSLRRGEDRSHQGNTL